MLAPSARCGKEHAVFGRVLPLVLAVAIIATVPLADARASVPQAVFALQPVGAGGTGYFILDARPGATVRRAVRVVNTGGRAGIVRLYAVDATTGATTGAVYRDARDPRRDVGGWVTLAAGRLRLAPGQSRTVALTVRVPTRTRDGQHLGGVVVENAALTRGPTRRRGNRSFRVDVRSLTIIALQVDVPGRPHERMALTGVRAGGAGGRQALLVGLGNDGNRLIKGRGAVTISDEHGTPIRHLRFPVDTFVPASAVGDPVPIPGRALPAGHYHATVTLRYGHGHVARLDASFAISDRQVRQVFGSGAAQGPGSSRRPSLLVLVLGGLALLAAGFGAALLVTRRRTSARAVAGAHDELRRP